jgi:hypothetical protein
MGWNTANRFSSSRYQMFTFVNPVHNFGHDKNQSPRCLRRRARKPGA